MVNRKETVSNLAPKKRKRIKRCKRLNPEKEYIRIYALDRIKNIFITDNIFQLPTNFDGESFFADCFGIVAGDGKAAENVLIKVHIISVQYDVYQSSEK